MISQLSGLLYKHKLLTITSPRLDFLRVWFLRRLSRHAQLAGDRKDAVLCELVINGGAVLPFILR